MKSVRAVLAGWAAMTLLVVVATVAAASVMLGGGSSPTVPYLTVNLLYSIAFAAVGGWITTSLAPSRAGLHAFVLALIVAALGSASVVAGPDQPGQPAWYAWTVTLLGACGILAGGAAGARRRRGGVAEARAVGVA